MTRDGEPAQPRSTAPVAEVGRHDAFLSYSRKDSEAAQRLGSLLEQRGQDVWVDVEDIIGGADWRARIKRGIEACKAFVFLLSPSSLGSEHCRQELELATGLNKLIIPVLLRDVDERATPRVLADREWIFLREADDLDTGLARLAEALETDLEWRDEHTRLAGRTREWLDAARDKSFLLRGAELREAELWLAGQTNHRESATGEQTEYILAGRRAAVARQRTLLSAVVAGLAIAVGLAVYAEVQRREAFEQRRAALSRALIAQSQTERASNPSLAGALSIEAYRLKPTLQARNAMLTLLAGLRRSRGPGASHNGGVHGVAFSPDGTSLATAGADETIRLWDVTTREPLGAVLRGHGAEVLDVAFDRGGTLLATAGGDGTVRLWDTRRHRPLAVLGKPGPAVSVVAFSPDGALLASAGDDDAITLWDPASRSRRGTLTGHAGHVEDIAFDRAGTTLASAGSDRTVRLWDVAGRSASRVLHGHRAKVYSVAFGPDGRRLASGDADGVVRLWDATSGRARGAFACQDGAARTVAFDDRGRLVCGGADDGLLRLRDASGGHALAALAGHTGIVHDVAVSRDRRKMASASADGTVLLWDVAHDGSLFGVLRGGSRSATTVAFGDSVARLATGGQDGLVTLWNAAARRRLADLRGGGRINRVAFSRDGGLLATGAEDGALRLWNRAEGATRPRDLPGHEGAVYGLAIAGTGDRAMVASGGADGRVQLVELDRGAPPVTLPGHEAAVTAVDFDARGRLLASVSVDGRMRLWDAVRRRPGRRLGGVQSALYDVQFSSDGATLATAAGDGTVQLWNVSSGRRDGPPLTVSALAVYGVAFSPDGATLATAAEDRQVRLWDVRSRRALGAPLDRHVNAVNDVEFSPDGSLLASASKGDGVRLWSSPLWSAANTDGDGELQRAICARVWRRLSRAEWRSFLPGEEYRRSCPGAS